MDQLFEEIPEKARFSGKLDIPGPLPEMDLMEWFERSANKNKLIDPRKMFTGAGAYFHQVPVAVDQLLLRAEFFTCYTPYQPEVSQGTLAAIYEFQTYTAALLGMEVANASMYDGPSALAEAVIMACRATGRNRVIMPDLVHPHWRQVVLTYAQHTDIEIIPLECAAGGKVAPEALADLLDKDTAAVVTQTPNFLGSIEDLTAVSKAREEAGALLIAATAEPACFGLLKGPGAFGADIAVAEGRSFGGQLNYGGPALGMFAVNKDNARKMPGRLVGKTRDSRGDEGYTLTLATREQHIRREKATSNICSNQALMATAAAMHISILGGEGLKSLALANLSNARYLADKLCSIDGVEMAFGHSFFNEFAVRLPSDPEPVLENLAAYGFLGGINLGGFYPELKNTMLLSATEVHTKETMDQLAGLIAGSLK